MPKRGPVSRTYRRSPVPWGPDGGWVLRKSWREVPDIHLTWHLYAYIERQKDKANTIRLLKRAKEIIDG